MPLRTDDSDNAVAYNIRELNKANKNKTKDKKRSQAQIVAIAMNAANRKK